MRALVRQLRPAMLTLALFTLVFGVGYPLVSTALGQVFFRDEANGSLIERDGVVVGSGLIGQTFVDPRYFAARPSGAGDGYDGSASSGSYLGPTNPDLLAVVEERAVAYRAANDLPADAQVPVDAVTASGSGLDPHISIANARIQAPRVAGMRDLDLAFVFELVERHTDERDLWILGEPGVNVVRLNLALDDLER